MRTQPLDDPQFHIPGSSIVGLFLAGMLGFLGWIIRTSARQVLRGFEAALERHGRSIDDNTSAIQRMQVHLAEIDARVKAIERD